MVETPTILLFGGYTEPWLESIDRIHEQAGLYAWLRRFMDDVASVVRAETKCMHPSIRNSLGPNGIFMSVQEVADQYRHHDDHVGFVQCIMSYIVQAVILLRWIHDSPDALKVSPRPEGMGISGGLINAAVLAISDDFESLYEASVVTAGLVCRLCEVAGVVSRAVELEEEGGGSDGSRSSWGCAVIGSSPDQLDGVLHQIQETKNVPGLKRARVGIRGDSWGTVVGPPSVLDMCLQHGAMADLVKQRLPIYSMQHNYHLSQSHRRFIAGSSSLHLRPVHPGFRLWGLQESDTSRDDADALGNAPVDWGRLLLGVVDAAFSNTVDLVEMVKGLNTRLGSDLSQVQLRIVGPTWFAGSLERKLKVTGRRVGVVQHTVLGAEGWQQAGHAPTKDTGTSSGVPNHEGRIAVVGMAGRAPECEDLEQYWQVIESGRDLAREIPPGRFDADSLFLDASAKQQHHQQHHQQEPSPPPKCTSTCKLGCFLSRPGHYDARFFRVSPREALLMDPGSRLFQMAAHEALESCGYSCGTTRALDPSRIGVLFGQSNVDGYETAHHEKGCDAFTLQALARPFPPARVAFHYGWEGPTYSIDQACSTSLSLIHLACAGLRAGDYDMVVAGAANVLASPHGWCLLSKAGVLSDTGNCKTFCDDAQGYCRGEFVGVVVLKRLEDAVAQNDRVLAVIPGSARNQAGNSTFLTASDAGTEERVLRQALRRARLRPEDIAYAEMHGTATPVGDPCEMTAVANVLGRRPKANAVRDEVEDQEETLTVGSVKASIGHSEASSGIASVIKAILMFQKNILPPQAGMPHALNKQFPPLHDKKIRILSKAAPFHRMRGKPRRVLINNFDAAGGNTALVLEDFERHGDRDIHKDKDPRKPRVVVLSAHTAASHRANKSRLAKWLRANPTVRLEDIAYTTTARRAHQPSFRFACAASSTKELTHALESEVDSNLDRPQPVTSKSPVIFVFTGQGSHYAGMGAELYHTSPVFRDTVDLCRQICDGFGFPPFWDVITGTGTDTTWNTAQTQLALVTLQIGLATFWRRLGVEPALVMGHSLGEYAALHVAGVLSLADALYLVGSRAALAMKKCDPRAYAMLAVSAPATAVREMMKELSLDEESCSIACVNSPGASVVSGTVTAVARLQVALKQRNIRNKTLPLPFGFHSSQVDVILEEFKPIASGPGITYSPPSVPVASTLLASIVDAETPAQQGFGPDYLAKQARNPVDFVGAIHAARGWAAARFNDKGNSSLSSPAAAPIWLEIGPGQYVVDKSTKDGKPHLTLAASLSLPALVALIQGHRMQGAGLCPGSVFCEAAFVAAKCALEHSGRKNVKVDELSLQKAHLRRPLTASLVGPEGSLLTTAVVESESLVLVSFKAVAGPGSPARSFDLGNCAVVVRKAAAPDSDSDSDSFYIRARMREVTRTSNSRLPASIFYALFSHAVQYGSKNYQCVREVFVSDDFSEAVAEVVPAVDPPDLRFVASSPYWGEALAHLAGFLVNCGTGRFAAGAQATTSFIMDSLERFEQRPGMIEPGRSYFTYARVLEKRADSAVCEVVVFDDKDRPAMRTWRMRFHEVPNAVLQSLLPRTPRQEQLSDTVLLPAPESNSSLLPGAPEPGLLDELRVPNGTTPDVQVRETESRAERSVFLEDELEHGDSDATKAPAGLLPVILESIAEETGLSDTSELTEDISLTDLGVDSIMAVEICARVKAKSSCQLSPSFILEHPTMGHLVRVFGRDAPQQQQVGRQGQEQELALGRHKEDDVTTANSHEPKEEVEKTASASPFSASPSSCSNSPTPTRTPATPPLESSSHVSIETAEPIPKARIMLLQPGRPQAGASTSKARLYLVCDGTGSISNYIHLLKHQFPLPVYGIDSPFLRCPSRLTPRIGIPGIARGMVEALVSLQPNAGLSDANGGSPIVLGGFSGGALFCYEMSRQLADQGRRVDGLILLDMRCPLPPPPPNSALPPSDKEVWEILFTTAEESMAGQIQGSKAESNTRKHLRTMFESVLGYHPPQRVAVGPVFHLPAVIIWCARGMVGRLEARRPDLVAKLVELGYPVESYPGYMEDPKLGAMAWSIPHKKTESELGPGGWENFVGAGEDGGTGKNLLCLAVDVDHHGVLYPLTAPKTAELIDQGVAFCLERKTLIQ
ncbi:hypothetical protein INS49_004739 [Diaporthe citri]|uniref:uncharacterized protein n=1 Tax=Diaporthe citri TaxID=83186 RepID=UPI001C7EAA4C|nr:uncharacterized protein INS49_004739 [Diaporthe citri]KAG6354135.1 hypothetical protein INS49_004739 [Diaporthe citri]